MNEVREHVADGIEEYDNPLPRWWLHLFYATIAFAAVYAMLYPSLWSWNGTLSWSSASQYDTQVAGAPSRHVAKAATDLETLARNPDVVAAGKSIFMTTCAMCHGDNGEGRVGPRLTDSTWKYGGDAKDILISIRDGRPGGMPVWGRTMPPESIEKVGAYVITLRDSARKKTVSGR